MMIYGHNLSSAAERTSSLLVRLLVLRENYMKKPEKNVTLHIRPRETETVSLEIPKDTLESLKKVAATRDMSCQALLKFYVGQGLRQDLSKLYADRVIETTEHVLTRHLQSEEVSAIMQEIRVEAVG